MSITFREMAQFCGVESPQLACLENAFRASVAYGHLFMSRISHGNDQTVTGNKRRMLTSSGLGVSEALGFDRLDQGPLFLRIKTIASSVGLVDAVDGFEGILPMLCSW